MTRSSDLNEPLDAREAGEMYKDERFVLVMGVLAVLVLGARCGSCLGEELGASAVCQQMGYAKAVKDGDQWACEQTPERIVPRGEER